MDIYAHVEKEIHMIKDAGQSGMQKKTGYETLSSISDSVLRLILMQSSSVRGCTNSIILQSHLIQQNIICNKSNLPNVFVSGEEIRPGTDFCPPDKDLTAFVVK